MMTDPNLAEIYNRFAATYEQNRGQFDMTAIFDAFYGALKSSNGHLLDLGCGAGEPFGRWFIERGWNVTGVDFSPRMLELANRYVPQMQTLCADMTGVDFPQSTFDAITSIYSLFHVPRAHHLTLFQKWASWLKPQGKVLFTYATHEYTGETEFDGYKTFMNEQLFYSHESEATLIHHLETSGLNIISAPKHDIGGETFLWVTAARR